MELELFIHVYQIPIPEVDMELFISERVGIAKLTQEFQLELLILELELVIWN